MGHRQTQTVKVSLLKEVSKKVVPIVTNFMEGGVLLVFALSQNRTKPEKLMNIYQCSI